MSNAQTLQREALSRATTGESVANYPAIFRGFTARGIPEAEIIPRVNVLTYRAWAAKGRQVRRGEHGVKVITWVEFGPKVNDRGEVEKLGGKRCKRATVFHVTQTDAREVAGC